MQTKRSFVVPQTTPEVLLKQAEKSIYTIIGSDDIHKVKETLRDMFLAWVVTTDDEDNRRDGSFHYVLIEDMINQAVNYDNLKNGCHEQSS